jgi:hypothetical protein
LPARTASPCIRDGTLYITDSYNNRVLKIVR